MYLVKLAFNMHNFEPKLLPKLLLVATYILLACFTTLKNFYKADGGPFSKFCITYLKLDVQKELYTPPHSATI